MAERRPRRLRLIALAASCLALLAGCAPRVQWAGAAAFNLRSDQRPRDRIAFIYFRDWYEVECTEFESTVFEDPAVVNELNTLYCIILEEDHNGPLAEAWGVDQTPGYVFLAPEGRVLAVHAGPQSTDEFVETLNTARARWRGEQPSTPEAAP